MKIYLDNCSFNRPFDDQASMRIKLETDAKLYIQEQVKQHVLHLTWSYMLEYENSMNPYKNGSSTLALGRCLTLKYGCVNSPYFRRKTGTVFVSKYVSPKQVSMSHKNKRERIAAWKVLTVQTAYETPEIVAHAKTFQTHGAHKKDAIHLACAVALQCEYFITTDKSLLNKRRFFQPLQVMNPVEFVTDVLEGTP